MAETIETRPFPPFLPKKATVMMMGTFPPEQSKRAMEFHYPNFQNDMWRVFGLVFFDEKDHFRNGEEKAMDPEKIKAFLSEAGIASCPTVLKAIRERRMHLMHFLRSLNQFHLRTYWSKSLTVSILVQQAARLRRFY